MLGEILNFILHETDLLVELTLPECDIIPSVGQLLSVRGLPLTSTGISLQENKILSVIRSVI